MKVFKMLLLGTVFVFGFVICAHAQESTEDYQSYVNYFLDTYGDDYADIYSDVYAQTLDSLNTLDQSNEQGSGEEETTQKEDFEEDPEEPVVQEFFTDDQEDLGDGLNVRARITLTRSLQNGIIGEDVKALQQRLAELGYNPGPVDGIFGSVTETAVLRFQREHGLYVDGIVGNISIKAINDLDAEEEASSSGSTETDTDTETAAASFLARELSVGSRGSDVTELQKLLESLGYATGGVDGVFGNYTMAAVRKFQTDHQLYVDGVIGPQTAGVLRKFVSRNEPAASGQSTAEQQKAQEPGAASTEEKLTWLPDTVIDGALSMGRQLGSGMSGDDVSTLQQRLFDLGYLKVSPDGIFGSVTEKAVIEFQKDHELYVDGLVGSQTLKALNYKHFLDEPVVSDLADSLVLTEKGYSREGEEVRFIIPHHMAGRMSGEDCASYFTYNNAGTSANYCIGYGGDIAANVPEQYGAWTSGDVNFDRKAITIEVSDTSSTDYRIPQEAQDSLVDLCVDIVKRYPSLGGRLVYDPEDESRVIAAKQGTGSWDAIKGNVLLHRWTTTVGTDCPGWYMVENMPNLVEKVNNKLQQSQQ